MAQPKLENHLRQLIVGSKQENPVETIETTKAIIKNVLDVEVSAIEEAVKQYEEIARLRRDYLILLRKFQQQQKQKEAEAEAAKTGNTATATDTATTADTATGTAKEVEDVEPEAPVVDKDEEESINKLVQLKLFVSNVLPEIVSSLLKNGTDDPDVRASIENLFQWILHLSIQRLHLDEQSFVLILRWTFQLDCKFYSVTKTTPEESPDDEEGRDEKCVAAPPEFNFNYSPTLLRRINEFNLYGGFDLLNRRLEDPGTPLNLTIHYLQLLFDIRYYLKRPQRHRILMGAYNRLLPILLSLKDDDLKQIPKNQLTTLFHILSLLVGSIPATKKTNPHEVFETFQLDFALKCLNSVGLEKRIYGISSVASIIEELFRQDSEEEEDKKYTVVHWITYEHLISWINTNDIFSLVFYDKIHYELVRRTPEIFKLLCMQNCLTVDHVKMLWTNSIGKQEALVKEVYTILKYILAYAYNKVEIVTYLFEVFGSIPASGIDSDLLSLFSEATFAVLLDGPEIALKGSQILWDLARDSSKLRDDLKASALSQLKQLFEQIRSHNIREAFIPILIENLEKHDSVVQSEDLLFVIINTHNKENPEDQPRNIELLQTQYGLWAKVLGDLAWYKNFVNKQLAENPATDISNICFIAGSQYDHRNQINCRFHLLSTIITSEVGPSIPEDDVGALWTIFHDEPTDPEDRNQFFYWLSQINATTFCPQSHYIFEAKLMHLDWSTVSHQVLDCYTAYFRILNNANNSLKEIGDRLIIYDYDKLIGLEGFWNIITNSLDDSVALVAIEFLLELFESLSAKAEATQSELYANFLAKVFSILKNSDSDLASIRCASLLSNFVQSYIKSKRVIQSHRRGSAFRVTVNNVGTLAVFFQDNLLELRNKVANFLKVPVETVELSCERGVLREKDYFRAYYELELEAYVFDVATRVPPRDLLGNPSDEELLLRRDLISNNCEFFSILIDLLNRDEGVQQQVWELLSILPKNPEQEALIKNIDVDTKWDSILSSSSTYKLQYNLQIVNSLINESHEWLHLFDAFGGFRHILHILVKESDNLHGPLAKSCLKLLVSIFSVILFDAETDTPKVVDWVPYPLLVEKTLALSLKLVLETQQAQGSNPEDVDLFNVLTRVLSNAVLSNAAAFETFLKSPSFSDFVRVALLDSRDASIRQMMARFLYSLSTELPEQQGPAFVSQLFGVLVNLLHQLAKDNQNCEEFFLCLGHLCMHEAQKPAGSSPVDLNDFTNTIVLKIESHSLLERFSHPETVDRVLIGLLSTLNYIGTGNDAFLKAISQRITKFLFLDCLMKVPEVEGDHEIVPVCKNESTRLAAFELLSNLASHSPVDCEQLLGLMRAVHLFLDEPKLLWNYRPALEQISEEGYVGVMNLGCICYMISLLQQLFMIPHFRRGVLSLGFDEEGKKDNILYELQRLFSYLQESHRHCYNPMSFCKANKDYEGNSTDISMQMDVDEFFNNLSDKLEEKLKGTPHENLLHTTWCGKTANQIIGRSCTHYSERAENFYTVSLDIKGKSTIAEALDLYVTGDVLEGENAYFCEQCDRKVDALMRRCIHALPNTLILNMKRFDFNFDTMRKEKLNDYVEFPVELDMFPYTREGLAHKEKESCDGEPSDRLVQMLSELPDHPADHYHYRLQGVVVHRGIADSGHYYSFIKERSPADERAPKWLEFNDDVVRLFDADLIERECFGGTEEALVLNEKTGQREPQIVARTRNAYLVVYERVNSSLPSSSSSSSSATGSTKMQIDDGSADAEASSAIEEFVTAKKKQESFDVVMPKSLYNEIWAQNINFLKEKMIFNAQYVNFVTSVIKASEVAIDLEYSFDAPDLPDTHPVHLAFDFLHRFAIHSREDQATAALVQALIEKLSTNLPLCVWVLKQALDICNKLLLHCRSAKIRVLIVDLLFTCFHKLWEHESHHFYPDPELAEGQEAPAKPITRLFVERLLDTFELLPWYWKTFGQYWQFLHKFAELDTVATSFLMARNFHFEIHNIIVESKDFKLRCVRDTKKRKFPKIGDRLESPQYVHAIGILSCMARSCVTTEASAEMSDEAQPSIPLSPLVIPGTILPLNILLRDIVVNEAFMTKVIKNVGNIDTLQTLTTHWMWENKVNSKRLMKFVLEQIDEGEWNELGPFFLLISRLILVEDSLHEWRLKFALTSLMRYLDENKEYKRYTNELINHIFDLHNSNREVNEWMSVNAETWQWVHPYIKENKLHVRPLQANAAWTASSSSSSAAPRGQPSSRIQLGSRS